MRLGEGDTRGGGVAVAGWSGPARRSFSASAELDAPAEAVYATLADYRDRHPRVIPNPPFLGLEVEAGGTGAGTVIRLRMRALGQVRTTRAVVSEPEPGRLLVERYDDGYATSFEVEPLAGGSRARVTIRTELPDRRGALGSLLGALEQWSVARLLRPVYLKEMRLLEKVARDG